MNAQLSGAAATLDVAGQRWGDWTVVLLKPDCLRRNLVAPVLLATIAPDAQRANQRTLLGSLLRDCDPDRDLLPGEPAELMIDVPFLDENILLDLIDERPIWRDPSLMARCRAFATAAMAGAEAFHSMLAERDDDF